MSGKVYQGERAIISMTSWKKRINTCGLTIFSILAMCPGFHIVLVLSSEEFPRKEAELPADIQTLVKANKIEILWVGPNLKAFKKWLPSALRYPNIPIISADDDCIYTCNYAQMLYDLHIATRASVCTCSTCKCEGIVFACGAASLYKFTPAEVNFSYTKLTPPVVKLLHDDIFYGIINSIFSHKFAELGLKYTDLCQCCMEIEPLSALYGNIRNSLHQMWKEITAN